MSQIIFKTLLGTSNLEFSISCLQSFVNNCEQNIFLQIFEDGSLTDNDIELISNKIPDSTIIKKKKRDKIILEQLKKFPYCSEYRNSTNYAQKLFDLPLFEGSNVLYIDSDIYFLKKFSLPEFGEFPVFMEDTHNAYSFQPFEFLLIKKPILTYINTGFFYFPYAKYDIELLESYLKNRAIRKGFIRKISWLEQTLWAMLASTIPTVLYFDRRQIMMAQQLMTKPILSNVTEKTIAVHLVFALRNYIYDELIKLPPQNENESQYSEIKLVQAEKFLSKRSFFIERFKKKWIQKTGKNYLERVNFSVKKE